LRPLIEKAAEILKNDANTSKPPRIIIEAPTAYGKSTAAPLMARILIESGWCHSFIHSLPLRAIVEDVYLCLMINAFSSSEALRNYCRKSETVLREVKESLSAVNIGIKDIAYQMGEHLLSNQESNGLVEVKDILKKEPLFDARYVITTLDSLAYNAFRVPVTEIFSYRKHYAIPRTRIFVSASYFDEAHMIYEEKEDEESNLFTTFNELLRMLVAAKTPIIVASATLSENSERHLLETLQEAKIVKLDKTDKSDGHLTLVHDKEFEENVTSIQWFSSLLCEENLKEKVKELIDTGMTVFIARDTIREAIKTFKELKNSLELNDDEIVLLHSLMTREDRNRALENIRDEKTRILVATSIVEAGVDISFNALITDASRASSVIQRTGRVCRKIERCKENKAYIFILENKHLDPRIKGLLENAKNQKKQICWRLPYDTDIYLGYGPLLRETGIPEINMKLKRSLETLASPLLISSRSIGDIVRNHGYGLVRTFLAEVVVADPELLNRAGGRVNLNKNSFVTSLNKLRLLASRGCIDGLYVALGTREKATLRKISPIEELYRQREEISLDKYFYNLQKTLTNPETRYNFVGTVFLLKTNCYEKNLGIKEDVLRI
jgi:CRISPR-associated endonuclease/helicase Cas3